MEETAQEKKGYGKRPMWQWIVLYLVIAAVLYGAFYYFVLAKKGGNSYNSSNPVYSTPSLAPAGTPSPAAAVSSEMKVTLNAENNSGETGTATLKEENGKTTVTLALSGYIKDVAQPAHIHMGACPGVGAVKYPLTSVVNGASVTVLAVSLADLKQSLPLAINVHKSATAITDYTSCGELSSK
jgi:flagellar basal body-associated protein FliL